jgi:HK97 family phage major capsid protein
MSPRVQPKRSAFAKTSEEMKAEVRSAAARGRLPDALSDEQVFWKYLLSPAVGEIREHSVLDTVEHRVLSKASSAAGGYLVPTSFDEQITAARRARAVIGRIARELVTGDGTTLQVATTTTHGTASWTRRMPASRPLTRPLGRSRSALTRARRK